MSCLLKVANRHFLNILQKSLQKKGRNHESSSLLRLSVNQITELSINAFLSLFTLHTGAFLAISYNKVYHSDGPLKCKLS